MKLLRRLMRFPWFRRSDAWLAEEIEHHRSLVQADLEARGLPPAEAAAASRRAMGNVTLAREDARAVWVVTWADRLWRDLKYGVRGLRREPVFSLGAILTLALGLATLTTVFSVVDAELWRPLPLPHPDRLVAMWSQDAAVHPTTDAVAIADWMSWKAAAPALADVAAETDRTRGVLRLDTAVSASVADVTPNYFDTLQRQAVAGRTFTAQDGDAPRPAVLTDRAWREWFRADPAVIGRVLPLDGTPIVVTGIVHADDQLGRDPDLFLSVGARAAAPGSGASRGATTYQAIGRLLPGADAETLAAQLNAAARRQTDDDPALRDARRGHVVVVNDLRRELTGYNWRPLSFFLGAATVVFLLAILNAALFILARAVRRTPELTLRTALGGGQGALVSQLAVEGALVGLSAGVVGLLVTSWAVRVFAAAAPSGFVLRGAATSVDLRVAAFALAAALVSAVVFALAPLPFSRRLDLTSALGAGQRTIGRRAGARSRQNVLVAQLALTTVLVAAAAMFGKSFLAIREAPLGFDPAGALVTRISLSGPNFASGDRVRDYARSLESAARAVPGVRDTAVASSTPLASGPTASVVRDDRAAGAGAKSSAIVRAVSASYFETLGMRLVRGRAFDASDRFDASRTAIINETLASQLFGGDNPIGQSVDVGRVSRTSWIPVERAVIVGVSARARDVGLNEVQFADLYVPFDQAPPPSFELVVGTAVPPATVSAVLRGRLAAVDPDVPVRMPATMADRVDNALRGDRFNLVLVGGFAAVALFLSLMGTYGAVAFDVQARQREFGVRVALGARPLRLVGAALGQAARLGVAGAGIGLAVALALAPVIGQALYLVPGQHDGLLYGVTTTDPAVLGIGVVAIITIALVAAALPARRAALADPLVALRSE